MTTQVQAPDGNLIEFPDTMSRDEIQRVMAEKYPAKFDATKYGTDYNSARQAINKLPKSQRTKAERDYAKYYVQNERKGGGFLQFITDHIRMAARNAPLVGEWADELNAGTSGLTGGDTALTWAAEQERRAAIDKTRYPGVDIPYLGRVDTGDVAKTAGLVGGSVAMPFFRIAKDAGNVSAGVNAAWNALLYGTSDRAGRKEGDVGEKASSAAAGAPLDIAGGYAIGNIGNRILGAARTKKYRPQGGGNTAEEIKSVARDAYRRAERQGLVLTDAPMYQNGAPKNPNLWHFYQNDTIPTFMDDLQDRVNRALVDMTHTAADEPAIHRIVRQIQEYTGRGDISFQTIDKLRSRALKITRDTSENNATQRAMAYRIISEIDDIISDLTPTATRYGQSPNPAIQAFEEGRSLWRRGVKTQIIEDAIERAKKNAGVTYWGGNINNATRQQFRRILNDPKMLKRFSNRGEREVIERVVQGSAPGNAARWVGSMAPSGGLTSGLHVASFGGASAAGGGPLALMFTGATLLSKLAGNKSTEKAAELVRRGVSSGRLNPHLSAWQRAVNAFTNGRLGEQEMKAATMLFAMRAIPEEGDDQEALYRTMFSEALSKKKDPEALFKEMFKESK